MSTFPVRQVEEPAAAAEAKHSPETTAASAAEKLMAKKTKEEAERLSAQAPPSMARMPCLCVLLSASPPLQARELLSSCGTTERGSTSDSWEERKREHDAQVKAGHAANRSGSARGAMEAFERACKLFPKAATTA